MAGHALAGAVALVGPAGGSSAAARRRPNWSMPSVKALTRCSMRWTRRGAALEQAQRAAAYDPRELERTEERLFALRAAARKYHVPVGWAAGAARAHGGRSRRHRARARAGSPRSKPRLADAGDRLPRGGQGAQSAARRKAGDGAGDGGQCRAAAAEAGARPLHRRRSTRDETARDARWLRPGRVLGADQPRHAAGPADEGRVRRRALALHAGAEGGAGGSRLGADAGVRRDRQRARAARWRMPSARGWRAWRSGCR